MVKQTQVTESSDARILELLRSIMGDDYPATDEGSGEAVIEDVGESPVQAEPTRMYTAHGHMCGRVVELTCGSDRCEHKSYVVAGTPRNMGSRIPSRVSDEEVHEVVQVEAPVEAAVEAKPQYKADPFAGVAPQMKYACREIGCKFFSYSLDKAKAHRDTKAHKVAKRQEA